MAVGGDGHMVIGLMWAMSTVILIFTALRTYTRFFLVKSSGMDDHVYVVAFVCLLMYTTFITVSSTYGFGQSQDDLPPHAVSQATFFAAIGQTFSLFGMAVAKWSLGLFLMRLVPNARYKIYIWIPLVFTMVVSLICIFFFWFECTPVRALWDHTVTDFKCGLVPTTPFYYLLGSSLVATDLFFAFFPWLFIWKLQMRRREKITILCSMSLGVFAAAFGIKRCIEIPGLANPNFLKAAVGIILWAAAEQCVTMVCIGIPICRPLYKKYLKGTSSSDPSNRYKGISESSRGVQLRTIGGSGVKGNSKHGSFIGHGMADIGGGRVASFGNGLDRAAGSSKAYFASDNRSDEEILSNSSGPGQAVGDSERGVIRVTEEFQVTSNK